MATSLPKSGSQHDISETCCFLQTTPTLTNLIGLTWTDVLKADVPESTHALRIIKQELWCCHKDGITLFDDQLRQLRVIQCTGVGECHDVAELSNGDVIVAGSGGLFKLHASLSGKRQCTVFVSMLHASCMYRPRYRQRNHFNAHVQSPCLVTLSMTRSVLNIPSYPSCLHSIFNQHLLQFFGYVWLETAIHA